MRPILYLLCFLAIVIAVVLIPNSQVQAQCVGAPCEIAQPVVAVGRVATAPIRGLVRLQPLRSSAVVTGRVALAPIRVAARIRPLRRVRGLGRCIFCRR